MYGSSSVLVFAMEGVTNGYTLDPSIGEYILTHPKVFLLSHNKLAENRKQKDLLHERGILTLVSSSSKGISGHTQMSTSGSSREVHPLRCSIRW